jgi:hypothetical protein
MILDANGKPHQERHTFGLLKIPEDARVTQISKVEADNPYAWVGTYGVGHKEHAERRAKRLGERE